MQSCKYVPPVEVCTNMHMHTVQCNIFVDACNTCIYVSVHVNVCASWCACNTCIHIIKCLQWKYAQTICVCVCVCVCVYTCMCVFLHQCVGVFYPCTTSIIFFQLVYFHLYCVSTFKKKDKKGCDSIQLRNWRLKYLKKTYE